MLTSKQAMTKTKKGTAVGPSAFETSAPVKAYNDATDAAMVTEEDDSSSDKKKKKKVHLIALFMLSSIC